MSARTNLLWSIAAVICVLAGVAAASLVIGFHMGWAARQPQAPGYQCGTEQFAYGCTCGCWIDQRAGAEST